MFSGPLISADAAVRALRTAVVLDARAGPDARTHWLSGHAPGARRLDLERDLSDVRDPRLGGRHPLPAWSAWLAQIGRWGITPATPVLIYDACDSGMAAARAWWMFRAVGHAPLAVVEGGWEALRRADVCVETGEVQCEDVGSYDSAQTGWSVVDAQHVERIRNDPEWALVDARAPERYEGLSEPIDPVAGHIPGAVNLYWKSNVDDRGTFLVGDALRERFEDVLGDRPLDRVVCYCGSAVTACHLLLAMEAAGLSGARLYVGSWSEWCRTRPDAISPE